MTSRNVTRVLSGTPAEDGAGVRLTRLIGGHEQNMHDPFLLFDVFDSDRPDDYIAGFPPHPHRGFATFTWMLDGRMRHRDSQGNEGLIGPGGAQWMHAGAGVIHSEMPEQSAGKLRGVQLWVNLPAAQKMSAPWYRDLQAEDFPCDESSDGVRVRVLAGTRAGGRSGPLQPGGSGLLLLDITLPALGQLTEQLAARHHAMAWVAEGTVQIGTDATPVSQGKLALLGGGESVQLAATAAPARVLLVAASPLQEPVARGGPFVMNTHEEIRQAFADFATGAFDRVGITRDE